ncbi:MAG: IS110 family transposase [Candidatus Aenigmarchaeota archaeon]|nr:IS110 family transposase [Candidatus Aenigmarchaeota archaeon]
MYYAGLDIHKDMFYGTILNEKDEVVVQGEFPNNTKALEKFFTGFHPGITKAAIEATGCWRGYYKTLQTLGYKVVLANPIKAKERSNKKKTDKVDSKTLAELLRTNFIPQVYIPTEEIMKLRDIARHRARIRRMDTKIKQTIKAYLLRDGIKCPKSIWNKEGLLWLESLGNPDIKNLIELHSSFTKQINEVTIRVTKISRNTETTRLLQTFPGIGYYGSVMIAAEIGDVNRFDSVKSLVMYAGLCPGIYQSANTNRNVKQTACNHWLKWIVYECSGRAAMLNTKYTKHYYKLKQRKGRMVARRSTARKIIVLY